MVGDYQSSAKVVNYLRMFGEATPDSAAVTRYLMQASLKIAMTANMLEAPERARAVKLLLSYVITRAGATVFAEFWAS